MTEDWGALLFIWGSVFAWNLTALLFSLDCLRVYKRSRREYRALLDSANGRKIVARGRLRISVWFLSGSLLGLLTGIMGAYRLTIDDLNSPLAMFTGAATRVVIVVMFFCFWRAKRTNVKLYAEAQEFYRSRIR